MQVCISTWNEMLQSFSICDLLLGLCAISPYKLLALIKFEKLPKHSFTTVNKQPVSFPGVCNQEERLGNSQKQILCSSYLRRFFFSFYLSLASSFLSFNQFSSSLEREAQGFLFPQRNQRQRKRDFAPRESAPILWDLSIMFLH